MTISSTTFGQGARRIGLIGHGAIGTEITGALERLGESDRHVATLVRLGRDCAKAVHDVDGLVAAGPDCVIECAGQQAAGQFTPALLRAGIDVVISSVGIFANEELVAEILSAERAGGARAMMPAGAIAGLDGLTAAALAGTDHVTYTSYKPPHAWRGTPAEQLIDLDHDEDEVCFFEGTARGAATDYPKNANVSVAVGLAGIGIDNTQVRLVSSRKVNDPLGLIEASGPFGHFRFEILALASPTNPKTSALTAYSLLQCARLGNAWPASQLIARRKNV